MGGERVMMLRGEKLKTLAKLIRYQEDNRIKSVAFKSEYERGDYLRDSEEVLQLALGLVDGAIELPRQLHSHNPLVEELARRFLGFVECGINSALRTMPQLHFRLNYLKKFQKHADALRAEILDLDAKLTPEDLGDDRDYLEAATQGLIRKVAAYEETYYRYMLYWNHPASQQFSLYLKNNGITFDKLVEMYQRKLIREKGIEFGGKFKDLSDAKKILVYNEIVVASGRGSLVKPLEKHLMMGSSNSDADKAGNGALLQNMGMSVWDIFKHAAVWAAKKVGKKVGKKIGQEIGTALGEFIVEELAVEAVAALAVAIGVEAPVVAAAIVAVVAAVAAYVCGYLLSKFAAWAVGKLFETGGKAPKDTSPSTSSTPIVPLKKRSQDTIHVYFAPMPDGNHLAVRLSYGDHDNEGWVPLSEEKLVHTFSKSIAVVGAA